MSQYRKIENELLNDYKLKLHLLRAEYVEKNKLYNIGDFIYNVTGIIKVSKIGYEIKFRDNEIEIVYSGHRYKKAHGELSRTKDDVISRMLQSHIKSTLK